MVLFFMRFFCCILLLIICSLISPGFSIGGRGSILLLAALIVGITFGIRWILQHFKIKNKHRIWLVGLGAIGILLAASNRFRGVNLSGTGIITVYLGMVGLEMILPEQSSQGFFRPNKQN